MQITIAFAPDLNLRPLNVNLFDLEEARQAERLAAETNGQIYCWKTTGRSNWLERGLSVCDVLGLIVLPKDLPDIIDMPDHPMEPQFGVFCFLTELTGFTR